MALLVAKCAECGFDNPRRWVVCARCGHLLGPSLGQTVTRRLSTVTSELSLSLRDAESAVEPHPRNEAAAESGGTGSRLVPAITPCADARPLVGRDDAIATLARNIELAFSERRVTITFLQGPPGSGRTRLLERASELAARQWLNTRVLYATCRSDEDGPFAPFSRYLLERFGVSPASSPSQVRADMLSSVADALEGADAAEVLEVTHLLGYVAAIPFPSSTILAALSARPEQLQQRAADALWRLFEGDARTRPVLLLLDDMQRADADAFSVLAKLARSPWPIAIVLGGSAELQPQIAQLSAAAPLSQVELAPLAAADVAHLVRALVPGLSEIPAPLLDALLRHSQGNPGALRELVRALDERGLFVTSAAGVSVDLARFERSDLPDGVSEAVRARLGALSSAERSVLSLASVVGELFWDGALLALGRSEDRAKRPAVDPILRWTEAGDEQRLSQILHGLEAKGFIVRLAHGEVSGLHEYTFTVSETRALLYAELDEERRRKRHAVVANWMSLATQLPAEGLSATLAQHLERAGRHAQAARAYLDAASMERSRLRTTMALRYAQRAQVLAELELGTRMEALHVIGSLLTTLGQYDAAASAFNELVDLAWQLGARGVGGAALNRLARIHRQRGEHRSALEFLHRALLLFRAANDERGVASTYDDMAQEHRTLGELEPAIAAAQRALEARRALRDARGEAVSQTTIGFIELDRGNLDAARARLEAAQVLRQVESDPEGALQTELGLGKLAYHEGAFGLAAERYARALERAREMNHRRLQSTLLNHLAEAELAQQRPQRARELLLEARSLSLELGDRSALTALEQNLALVALAQNESGAEQQLRAALDQAREHGTRENIAQAHRGLARLYARTAPDEQVASEGEARFREAIRIFEESGNLREAARTRAELGFHLMERGAGARARAALGEAYAALKPLSLPELSRVTDTLEQLSG